MLNVVTIAGTVAKEPEFKTVANGVMVASFSIAWKRQYAPDTGMKDDVYYFDVDAYGKNAEQCKTLFKSQIVVITGSLKQERWQSKNGEKKSKVKIIADRVHVICKN